MYMITKFIISKRNAETDSIYLKVADGAVLNIKAKSIDEQGNLLDGYSFVGVKLNIRSEKELNINTASFVLRGISKDEYFDASCFYQDGKRTGTDVHEGGIAVVHPGTTELTVGFFADEAMMKCEKFLLIPTVIETEDGQNHYIEITIRKGD